MHIGHLPTWEVHLSLSFLLPLSYCSWGSQGKNTEEVCHPLLQWTTFSQTSPPWPVCLAWPQKACLNFIELDKAVVGVTVWLIVCDCGFSLYAFWCPLSVPTILLGFLLPWTWGLYSQLPQESAATAPYLRSRVAPLGCHSWSWAWQSSSPPHFCTALAAALLLHHQSSCG